VSVACALYRVIHVSLTLPVPQFPHGQRFVEVRKAFEGDVAGKHVKWHDAKLVDRRLVVQDDVWSVVSL
jgi:hypothetical protein